VFPLPPRSLAEIDRDLKSLHATVQADD